MVTDKMEIETVRAALKLFFAEDSPVDEESQPSNRCKVISNDQPPIFTA